MSASVPSVVDPIGRDCTIEGVEDLRFGPDIHTNPETGDFVIGSTGDLVLVRGLDAFDQWVERTVVIAAGAYAWWPEYGAGLGRYQNEKYSHDHVNRIEADIRTVLKRDPRVVGVEVTARSPEPGVLVVRLVVDIGSERRTLPVQIPGVIRG